MLRISPAEVRRGPQQSRAGSGGPARPTALRLSPVEVRRGPLRSRNWQMRSGAAHCDQELADEEEEEEGEGGGGGRRRRRKEEAGN